MPGGALGSPGPRKDYEDWAKDSQERAGHEPLAHGEALLLSDACCLGPEDQADNDDGPKAQVAHMSVVFTDNAANAGPSPESKTNGLAALTAAGAIIACSIHAQEIGLPAYAMRRQAFTHNFKRTVELCLLRIKPPIRPIWKSAR
jgi:hypothetical protein